MKINYENPEVVARQNIAPNAGCDIDGVFYDMRNCVHLLKEQADRIEELEAKLAKAVEALRQISDDASVPVHTRKIGYQYYGVNFKKMYEGWRNIATNRKDHARAALAELKGEDRG
jgi:hypothetical protein